MTQPLRQLTQKISILNGQESQNPEVNINLKHGLPKQQRNEEGDQNIPATQHHSAQQEQHNVMPVDHRMQKLISI